MKNQKLSKGIIKEIVKECLIEILAEGLVSNNKSQSGASRKSKTLKENMLLSSVLGKNNSDVKRNKSQPSYLDSIKFKNEKQSQQKNEKLNQIAASVTKDPILSEMLMDTAHTTLQDQIAAESKKGYVPSGTGDQAQKIVESSSDPSELFGKEASSKWASLAFGN